MSAVGLGVIVLGTLQSSTWGWVVPKDSPITPLGFSLTIWMIVGGGVLLWAFTVWQRHREKIGADPLVHMGLLRIPSLRAGLTGLFSQNLVLMGVFFVVPLYLQLVLGLDALQTGIKMLPISITMFLAAAAGSRLSARFTVRGIVRAGLTTTVLAVLILLATVEPDLRDVGFAVSMAILGVGMGLMASQLGNVVQSSVDASGRGEAGGLQYTGQQLGSSLGVALIGAIVLTGLTSGFVTTIQSDQRISAEVSAQVGVAVEGGLDFVSADQVRAAAEKAGLDPATTAALVEDYSKAQLGSLKVGLLTAALLALLALMSTRELPHDPPAGRRKEGDPELSPSPA
jgi:Na+/melibiose symporter-like transporter